MRSWANRFVVTSAVAAFFVPGVAFAAEEARPHPQVEQPSRVEAEPPPAHREQPRVDPGSSTGEVVSRGGGSASGRLVPADRETAGRPDGPVSSKPSPRFVKPPSPARYTERPTSESWRLRTLDVETYIKRLARKVGLVRSLLVPDELTVVKGCADRPAGLSSYAFVVPGKGTIRVSLSHPNEGWLRMGMVDKEGHPEKGMVQNLVDDRHLQVSFKNPRDEVRIVHVLVDDPGWMSSVNSLYTLRVERDWDLGKVEPGSFKREHGIWAIVDPVLKIEAPPPSEPVAGVGG